MAFQSKGTAQNPSRSSVSTSNAGALQPDDNHRQRHGQTHPNLPRRKKNFSPIRPSVWPVSAYRQLATGNRVNKMRSNGLPHGPRNKIYTDLHLRTRISPREALASLEKIVSRFCTDRDQKTGPFVSAGGAYAPNAPSQPTGMLSTSGDAMSAF